MAEAQGTTPEPRRYLSPLFSWRGSIAAPSSGLSTTERHVALSLSLHMNEKGGSCFPSVPTLAEETGYDERTVRRSLRSLEDAGWITCKRGGGRGFSNHYSASLPAERGALSQGFPEGKGGAGAVKGGTDDTKGGHTAPRGRQEDASRSLGGVCEKCSGPGWLYADNGTVTPCECRGFTP